MNAKTERLFKKGFNLIKYKLRERDCTFNIDLIKIDFDKATLNRIYMFFIQLMLENIIFTLKKINLETLSEIRTRIN